MSAPATAHDVVTGLSALTERLYSHVRVYAEAEMTAVKARAAADLAESKAFLSADGAMDLRRHQARVEAYAFEEAALVAEAVVRTLKAKIRALETDIDVHRTMGATVRAELKTVGFDGQP